MPEIDKGILELILEQSIGLIFGITCLIFLYFTLKEKIKDKNQTIKQLKDIIHERKTDRDGLLGLMGEIRAYLATARSLEQIAQHTIVETMKQDENKRRRRLDRIVKDTLSNE